MRKSDFILPAKYQDHQSYRSCLGKSRSRKSRLSGKGTWQQVSGLVAESEIAAVAVEEGAVLVVSGFQNGIVCKKNHLSSCFQGQSQSDRVVSHQLRKNQAPFPLDLHRANHQDVQKDNRAFHKRNELESY